jgi:hypothetical protein
VKHNFDKLAEAIVLAVEFDGPAGTHTAQLVLDTGAATTVIAPAVLMRAGYGPSIFSQPVQVISASGAANAAILRVSAVRALGHEATDFPIIAHTMSAATGVDGVLGLDFLRGQGTHHRLPHRLSHAGLIHGRLKVSNTGDTP